MATFESPVKIIPAGQEVIFNKFSNLKNLEAIKDRIPQDKVKDFTLVITLYLKLKLLIIFHIILTEKRFL